RRTGRPFFRRRHERLWRDVFLRVAPFSGRPVGDCSLHPRLAAESACHAGRCGPNRREATGDGATMKGASFAAQCTRWKMRALVLGLIAGIVCVIGAFFDRAQFSHSYLFAWLFWIGLSLGALVIVMMQALTGGKWGAAVSNLSTAAFMTLPLMALLFLPVLLGAHQIYGWSVGAFGEAPGYHHKEQWLNLPFFVGRSFFYF